MTEEKPFYCISCLSKFTRKSHLNRHLYTHSTLTQIEIDEQLKKFKNIKDIYVKKKTVSTNIKYDISVFKLNPDFKLNLNPDLKSEVFPIYTPNPNLVFPIPGLDYLSD